MAKRELPPDLLGALLDSLVEAKQERERREDDVRRVPAGSSSLPPPTPTPEETTQP